MVSLLLLCPLPLFLGQNSAYPNNRSNRFIHNTGTYHPNYLLSQHRNQKSVFSGLTASARWQCHERQNAACQIICSFYLSTLLSTSPTWGPEIFKWHWLGTVPAPLPTFRNYNWPKALKPSHKTNTSSTVIIRPPNWNNTATLNIEAVPSSKMSEHLTTTQVRNPNDDSGQINNCIKSPKLLQVRFFITVTH